MTPMTPLTWNTDWAGNRSRIHGKWINWLDQTGWRALDGGFREDAGGRYVADRIPGIYSVPALATGSVEFEVNQRRDIFSKTLINEAPWSLEFTPENVSPVSAVRDDNQPDRVMYPNAWGDGVDLRYTVWLGRGPRVTREVVIRKEPPGDADIQVAWRLRSQARAYVRDAGGNLVRPWAGNVSDSAVVSGFGVILRSGTSIDNESVARGSGIRTPKAWYYKPDGTLVTTNIQIRFEILSPDTVRATKIIPRAFVREAFAAGATTVMSDDTNTFYPDPNTESTSVDGFVQQSGGASTWATLRDGPGASRNDSGTSLQLYLSSHTTTNLYLIMQRLICLFDTSALAGAAVESATIALTATGTRTNSLSTYDFGVALVSSSPASNTELVNSDYPNLGTTRLCDTDVLHANPMSGTKTWALNGAGIAAVNTTGISKFGFRHEWDFSNTHTWKSGSADYLYFHSAEAAGTSSDPYLEVVTGAGGPGPAGNPAAAMMMGLIP